MKKLSVFLLAVLVIAGCKDQPDAIKDEPARAVTQYSIEQFYKSSDVFGGAFPTDDSKLLVTTNETGIYNPH